MQENGRMSVLFFEAPQMGPEISSLLPFRGVDGIASMAQKMGVPGPDRGWTADDDEIIKAQYPHMGSSVASLLDGRHTEGAYIQRAQFLGLSHSTEESLVSKEPVSWGYTRSKQWTIIFHKQAPPAKRFNQRRQTPASMRI